MEVGEALGCRLGIPLLGCWLGVWLLCCEGELLGMKDGMRLGRIVVAGIDGETLELWEGRTLGLFVASNVGVGVGNCVGPGDGGDIGDGVGTWVGGGPEDAGAGVTGVGMGASVVIITPPVGCTTEKATSRRVCAVDSSTEARYDTPRGSRFVNVA